jgi:integrase
MYGSDIGTLKQSEVNWEKGRIKRKRSKTRSRSKSVPLVDYVLWQPTFDLLKQFRSKDKHLVLINENGLPLWRESEDEDSSFCRHNNIKTAYFHLLQQLKLTKEQQKPFKTFRKTGASMLDNSVHGRFSEHYLGETPRSIANKHYIHKNGIEFDAAIQWLGQQLRIV